MKRIISCSYKDDTPAFFSEEFFDNYKKGFVTVETKYRQRRILGVALTHAPSGVRGIDNGFPPSFIRKNAITDEPFRLNAGRKTMSL